MNKKISIITVVYNGISYIEETIKSVIHQSYSNIEYIIIDGNSRDGTKEIIKKYEPYLSYWVSESDKGIYDAMNKGIKKCTGDWIIFMNCGDYFYNKDVLNSVFSNQIPTDISVIYGGAHVRSSWGNFIIKTNPCNKIWKSFVHQSLFSEASITKKLMFNLNFKAAADYDFVYALYSQNHKFMAIKTIVSDILYIDTGFSSVNEILSKKEVLKSIIMHKNNSFICIIHYLYHLNAYIRKRISIWIRCLSPELINVIRKLRDKHLI